MRFPPTTLPLLLLNYIACILLYSAAHVLYALITRIEIEEIILFNGPQLFSFHLKGIRISVRPIPFSAAVKLRTPVEDHEFPLNSPEGPNSFDSRPSPNDLDPFKSHNPNLRHYNDLHPLERIAFTLLGPLALFLISALLLGPSPATAALTSGFPQVFRGALSPIAYASPRIADYLHLTLSAPWPAPFGLLAAKVAAVNSLPLPGLTAGGAPLLELLRALYPPITSQPTFTRLTLPLLFIFATMGLLWLYALAHTLFRT